MNQSRIIKKCIEIIRQSNKYKVRERKRRKDNGRYRKKWDKKGQNEDVNEVTQMDRKNDVERRSKRKERDRDGSKK